MTKYTSQLSTRLSLEQTHRHEVSLRMTESARVLADFLASPSSGDPLAMATAATVSQGATDRGPTDIRRDSGAAMRHRRHVAALVDALIKGLRLETKDASLRAERKSGDATEAEEMEASENSLVHYDSSIDDLEVSEDADEEMDEELDVTDACFERDREDEIENEDLVAAVSEEEDRIKLLMPERTTKEDEGEEQPDIVKPNRTGHLSTSKLVPRIQKLSHVPPEQRLQKAQQRRCGYR
ncbi:unnamed protein product [Protopolystoma xenopodis]|uniref:Uncharacterized protein n=1 Tax=Protopolystoma xenopodis TaxID=117903 RepID=A0A448X5K7_9PLAT|nr:unnamed protein product [Protopolystoma xenopodis]